VRVVINNSYLVAKPTYAASQKIGELGSKPTLAADRL